jgi:hypothetical protein
VIDLVNGFVVGIPEFVLVMEVVIVLVTLTVRVKLPEGVLVLRSEGFTVTKALGLLVNGKDVGTPERVRVKEVDLVLVTLTVRVKLPEGVLVLRSEGFTVTKALGVIVIEEDLLLNSEGNTVIRGVGDLVNGGVVGIGEKERVWDTVTDKLLVLETVIVIEVLRVNVCETDLVNDLVTVGERVNDSEFVSESDFVRVNEVVKLEDLVECGVVGFGVKESVRLFVRERLFVKEVVIVKEVLFVKEGDTDLVKDIVRVGEIDCVKLFVRDTVKVCVRLFVND